MRIQSAAAAALSGLSKRTIQARAPEIPGAAKLFGRWTFDHVRFHRWIAEEEAARFLSERPYLPSQRAGDTLAIYRRAPG